MSAQELTTQALTLSAADRAALALTLWESIDLAEDGADEQASISEAIRRDEELSSGKVIGRTHEQVMEAARHALGCA